MMSRSEAANSRTLSEHQPIRFGAHFWPQSTDWESLRDAAIAAEDAGWDSIWTWDHLLAIRGSDSQPIFEGWVTLATWAALTTRVQVGLMVGANTFRNPGLTAKLASTLDHASGGRAVLGIGGAWFEREHDAFGIDFGTGFGERLDRMDEAVMLMRRLLDGERFTYQGRHYRFADAISAPRPLQKHLPILIGGSGPRKTLRTVARYGDAWNTAGDLATVRNRLAILRAHCSDVGRDPNTIELTADFDIVLRDDRRTARATFRSMLRHYGVRTVPGGVPVLLGPPDYVAARIRPYLKLGFRTVIARLGAPYDRETIKRMGEVRAELAKMTAAG